MTHVPLLDELAIVAALGAAVTVILSRLRLPAVAGLLLAGALLGPFGLKLVQSVEAIETLAEVGVVLLLFSIGLEFSLARLRDIFRRVALGGVVQVGLTALVTTGIAWAIGEPPGRAVLYGFVVALSSTAIVLRALTERRELDAPHGRFIVGTLIFQDLCVIPMMLVVPALAEEGEAAEVVGKIGYALVWATAVMVGTVVVARQVVPRVLRVVDASKSREAFLLAIVGLCIGTAWLTAQVGLSLALGAFLGGVVVADTEFGHRAMGDILPLRDVFVSLFFVSLGMLFDVQVVLAQPLVVAALLAAFLVGKGILATLAALVMRFPRRVAWLAGVGLAQFGEFGFVLTRQASDAGLVDDASLAPLLAAGIMSMFLTPLLVRVAPHITAGERLLAPLEALMGVRPIDEADEGQVHMGGHVVVVGFGLAGRLVARSLQAVKVDFVVLELNAENVRAGKAEGLPVYSGDATSEEALRHAHLETARAVVLLMNDPQGVQRVVDTVRRVAPEVVIIVRSRYLLEAAGLTALGATEVVAEEVEGAVEILTRVLKLVEVPRNVIDERVDQVRMVTQVSARPSVVPRKRLPDVRGLDELKIESALVREGSRVVRRSAVELKLRSETGALMVGVRRDGHLVEPVDPGQPLLPGDVVYLVGTVQAIRHALALFDPHDGQA